MCPRYYTDGSSRCLGCGGEGFAPKHPSGSLITCCEKSTALMCALSAVISHAINMGELPGLLGQHAQKNRDAEQIQKESLSSFA